MAYPQGFLFPPLSSCPSMVLGPRAGHEGSAFAPYTSTSPHVPYGGEARAAAAINSFLSPGFEPPPALDYNPFGPLGPGSCHPYADPAYRKNATRDATATLKAWLSEHRKNPYPTKGEKIMLAIVTKMTLTQVSTWFANARRRLKKENKMTWTPRNRSEDEEEDELEADRDGEFGAGQRDEHQDQRGDTGPGPCPLRLSPDPSSSDCSPVPPLSQRQEHPPHPPLSSSPHGTTPPHPLSCPTPPPPAPDHPAPKPKLWSLAEIATSSDRRPPCDPPDMRTSLSLPPRPLFYPPSAYLYSHYGLGLYPRPERDLALGLRTFGHDKGEQQRLVPP